MRALIPILLLGACRFGFEDISTGDGMPGGDATDATDATDAANPCMTFGPWSAPTNVTELNTVAAEVGAALHPDRKTIVFARGGSNLYVATRTGTTGTFSTPQPLFSPMQGYGPTWTATGDRLLFSDDTDRLIESAFNGTSFATPVVNTDLGATPIQSPSISTDGLELFFGDNINSAGLWRATRANPTAPWTSPQALTELDTTYYEGWPSISSDGLTLYFETTRTDTSLYMATRSAVGAPFSNVVEIPELNTAVDKSGSPDLSRDGTIMFLASNRPGTAGGNDLWISTRSCL